jgi:alginate O-acetyltransferase complex protein AlgI
MKLLLPDGRVLGGIDSWIQLLRALPALRPLAWLLQLPGIHPLALRSYRWIARHRYCVAGSCALPNPSHSPAASRPLRTSWIDGAFSASLPALAAWLAWNQPAWVLMWSMALALGLSLKWLTLHDALRHGAHPSTARLAVWFLAWPGLDARAFFDPHASPPKPRLADWLRPLATLAGGAALLMVFVPPLVARHPLLAGWIAMIGLVATLHFGAFELLSLLWRHGGIDAQPIMRRPLRAASLGDFWGARWNTAFGIAARRLMLAPMRPLLGGAPAVLIVFFVSGLLHELVISLPARSGYGLPTAYFLLQGFGLLAVRTRAGLRLGLRGGLRARAFAWLLVAGPAYWLFPPAFVRAVIVPMSDAMPQLHLCL